MGMYSQPHPFDPYCINIPFRMGRPKPGETPPLAVTTPEILKVSWVGVLELSNRTQSDILKLFSNPRILNNSLAELFQIQGLLSILITDVMRFIYLSLWNNDH